MQTNGQYPAAGAVARQDALGNSELAVTSDVQSAALTAQATAEVQARWAIAQRNPRNIDGVRVALLKECDRPGFADVAKYAKPVGKDKVVGPSIRFVEAALRCMGNVLASTTVVSEDRQTRRLQVMVTDLESNVSWPRQITLEKTVERRDSKGRTVVGERVNSYGDRVYVVIATEDELLNKEAAAVSKAIRTAGLRVIPGDLVEEAMARVDSVRNNRARADPAGERKKLVDAFVSVGVTPEQLVEYLKHSLDTCQPLELVDLRDVYAALRDGETTWRAVMEQRSEADPVQPPPQAAKSTPPQPPAAPAAAASSDPGLVAQLAASVAGAANGTLPTPTPPKSVPTTADELIAAITAATKPTDLNPLASRIGKLSDVDKARVMPAYTERAKVLRGAR